jgi:beta-glucosidase
MESVEAPPGTSADRVEATLAALSLEEKASLTSGLDSWHTVPVPRLAVPSLTLSDGPNGARGATSAYLSLTPSVCIPSATALAATWDPELVAAAAAAVARQARDKGARVLLAPTVNLHRHPLWGRNFEAFSEDPLLTARLATAYIGGVQSQEVAATVKHFVANETEWERYTSSSEVDERTLRELYLLPFEHAVRLAGVLAVMTSYNRVNGLHVPDDVRLVSGILRGEWGFGGVVMTDWLALLDTVSAGRAGLDLEMPGPPRAFGPRLAEAVRAAQVEEAMLDAKVRRLLQLIDRVGAYGDPPDPCERPIDRPEDRALTRRAAADAIVLLTNRRVLPVAAADIRRIALVGPNAERLTIMGGGSASVVPHYEVPLPGALRERIGTAAEIAVEDASGPGGIDRAVALARRADLVIAVVGSPPGHESEGYDRERMDLPGSQDELLARVLEANPRSVVAVNSGAPVTMPWADRAGAVLQVWFGGQEQSRALVDVILGGAEPGGRLPTTFPLQLEHTPAYGSFPGESSRVRYAEGLLVGYRWYEARRIPVRFPFGHGLSYTSFRVGPPRLVSPGRAGAEPVEVEVRVTNTGPRAGSEVVQLYVEPPDGGRQRPGGRLRAVKELRSFAKVRLDPGESRTVRLALGARSFAHYDVADTDWERFEGRRPTWRGSGAPVAVHRRSPGWYVDPGTYRLHVGRSAAEIAHSVDVEVAGGPDPLDPALLPD